MKKTILALVTVATVVMMTGPSHAKKWTIETVNVKDGKATVVGEHQTTCNYHEAMKMARDFQDDQDGNFVRFYGEDDLTTCPKVSRSGNKPGASTTAKAE